MAGPTIAVIFRNTMPTRLNDLVRRLESDGGAVSKPEIQCINDETRVIVRFGDMGGDGERLSHYVEIWSANQDPSRVEFVGLRWM